MDLMAVCEGLYYCNNLEEISGEKGAGGGEIWEPTELYHEKSNLKSEFKAMQIVKLFYANWCTGF